MNKLHQQITKISASMIFIAAIMTSAPSLAESTTLNGVEISSTEGKGYDIVLNTDTATNVQTKEATSDKLVLDLKNTKVAKDANTVYKDADGIENVILKPKANNLEIEINGKEAGQSKVSLNNEIEKTPKNYENTVFVNLPMHSYAPVRDIEAEASESGLIWLLRSIKNSQSLRSLLSSANLGWILCFALMFGFLVMTNLKNRPQRKVNVKIGNDDNLDKENTLLKQALARKEGLIAEGLGSQTRTTISPKAVQLQPQRRTIQPQQPTAQRQNYGLRAYGNQPANASNNSFKIQSTPLQRDVLSAATGTTRKPMRVATATKQELREDVRKNEVRIDNVKFLESMAKIYERSGRSDLASGLANNIKRARTAR
ncbi:MAG: AMIN domain-containing protein [Candidatus Gastranaerophilales bacterium]|nr:AMIN domain-containing protein [Candidatus Gastranaerophilales bacterium]